jgi:hypothetical protein
MNRSRSPHTWLVLVAIGLVSVIAGIVLTVMHGFTAGSIPPLLAGSMLAWSGVQRAIRPAATGQSSASSILRRLFGKIPKELALLIGVAILGTGLTLTASHGFSVSLLPLLGSGTAWTITSFRRFLRGTKLTTPAAGR